MTDANIRDRIAEESVYSLGTGNPLRAVLEKPSFTVGWLGGSVTTGYIHLQILEEPFPVLLTKILRERGYDAHDAVCAAPGMDTMIGNLVADELLFPKKPDIVFLEFAINETTLRHSVASFESLLRKLLTQEKPPVVGLVILRSAGDYSCESFMIPMAEHYGLPCVNFRTGMNAALARGDIKWEDYGDSESHPTPDGHQLLADCMAKLFEKAAAAPSGEPAKLPEPWMDAPFTALRYLHPETDVPAGCTLTDRWNFAFPKSWLLKPELGNVTFSVTCSKLVIFYEVRNSSEYGSCRVLIDGKPVPRNAVLNGYSIYGWGNPVHAPLIMGSQCAEHTVTLEPADGDFYVLGFGIES